MFKGHYCTKFKYEVTTVHRYGHETIIFRTFATFLCIYLKKGKWAEYKMEERKSVTQRQLTIFFKKWKKATLRSLIHSSLDYIPITTNKTKLSQTVSERNRKSQNVRFPAARLANDTYDLQRLALVWVNVTTPFADTHQSGFTASKSFIYNPSLQWLWGLKGIRCYACLSTWIADSNSAGGIYVYLYSRVIFWCKTSDNEEVH
jgi:hypothetical protein